MDKTEQMFTEILAQLKIMSEIFEKALTQGVEREVPEKQYMKYGHKILEIFEDGQPRHTIGVFYDLKKMGITPKSESSLSISLNKLYHAGKLDKLRQGVYVKKGMGEANG